MTLYRYIARRVLLLFPMLVGITLLSFLLSHAVPADPVAANPAIRPRPTRRSSRRSGTIGASTSRCTGST
jgi:ABC-type dipeptide/oligopeptide/nickel transport system permease component